MLLHHITAQLSDAVTLQASQSADIAAWHRSCLARLEGLSWLDTLLPEQARPPSGVRDDTDPWRFAVALVAWQRCLQSGLRPTRPISAWACHAVGHTLPELPGNPWPEFLKLLEQLDAADPAAMPLVARRFRVACRQLLHAVLAARVLGCPEPNHALTLALLTTLHNGDLERERIAAALHAALNKNAVPQQVPASDSLALADGLQVLRARLDEWLLHPGRDAFEQLVISTYRLLVASRLEAVGNGRCAVLASLHFSAASCLTVRDLYWQESAAVAEVLQRWCVGSGHMDCELVGQIAALECRIAFRLPDDEARYSLASGLFHLPRPGRICQEMQRDRQRHGGGVAGPWQPELIRELEVLVAGARELGVLKVEALAAMTLELHRQWWHAAIDAPQLVMLDFAHRQLCRLLDQAAAWQTAGDIGATMARLATSMMRPQSDEAPQPLAPAIPWNLHMTGLIQRSRDLQDIRGLLLEILACQRNIPHQM